MHPELEREVFINHLTTLRQENERLSLTPAGDQRLVLRLKAQVERLEADNAVLRARLETRMREPARPLVIRQPQGQGCRSPQSGLGLLSYAQVVELHERQVDQHQILAMAGVTRPSLSRWRKANGFIQAWVPRSQAGGSTSPLPLQDQVQGDQVLADGRDHRQAVPGVPVGQGAA